MKGTWKILKQAINKGNNALTCIDFTVHENQTITYKKLMPEIFNDHFVNTGEKLANKIDETNIDPLENVPETEKGLLLRSLTQTRYIEPYLNLKCICIEILDNFNTA